jgi:hypothetical protein
VSLVRTVGELKDILDLLPRAMPIKAGGADAGGYDIQECEILSAKAENGTLHLWGDHGDPTCADTRPEGNPS